MHKKSDAGREDRHDICTGRAGFVKKITDTIGCSKV
jgi:hypothetical protein